MAELGSRSVGRCSSSLIRWVPVLPDFFNTLTEELIIEVLKRLPLKEANRCKCVCTRWLDTISAPYFARCYIRHRSSFPPSFALCFRYKDTVNWKVPVTLRGVQLATDVENHPVLNSPGFSFTFLRPSSSFQSTNPVHFLSSSNGLVLCSTTIYLQRRYYVCNPVTMHWVALPPPPTCPSEVINSGFICIPDFNSGIISRFKVVQIVKVEYKSRLFPDLRLEIFSSETGEWTDSVISGNKPVFSFEGRGNGAVVCNGILHWRYVYGNHIFAFDPFKKTNEEFRTIALPKGCCNRIYGHLFGESRGHLTYAELGQFTFRVWEIVDYNSGEWSLVHKFHLSEMVCEEDLKLAEYRTWSYLLVMLAFHPIERDIVFLGLPGRILECNLRSRSLKLLCKLAHPAANPHRATFPYVLPWWPISVPQC